MKCIMRNRLVQSLLFSMLVTVSLVTMVAQPGGRGPAGAAGGNTLGRGAAPLVPENCRTISTIFRVYGWETIWLQLEVRAADDTGG